jgi:hypothetical protein
MRRMCPCKRSHPPFGFPRWGHGSRFVLVLLADANFPGETRRPQEPARSGPGPARCPPAGEEHWRPAQRRRQRCAGAAARDDREPEQPDRRAVAPLELGRRSRHPRNPRGRAGESRAAIAPPCHSPPAGHRRRRRASRLRRDRGLRPRRPRLACATFAIPDGGSISARLVPSGHANLALTDTR